MIKHPKLVKGLLYPPGWLTLLLTLFSTVSLIAIFVKGLESTPMAYAVYAVSFYTLVILCVFFISSFPKRYRELKRRIYAHPIGKRYMTDTLFKLRISLMTALVINLSYSIFKLGMGILYSSFWIGAFAVYYILLSSIRFLLLRDIGQTKGMHGSCRITAILMLLIDLTLFGIVFSMIIKEKKVEYPDAFIIASAAYTFYVLTMAIVGFVKYRSSRTPVISAAKAVSFTQSLVSLLSLESSMLMQFGNDEAFRRRMLLLSGGGAFVVILAMSIYVLRLED